MESMIIDQIKIVEAMVLTDGFIWCMAGGFNAFFQIDIISGQINYLGEVPNEKIQKARLYSDIQQYEDKLIFVPMAAEDIAIYNIKENKFIKIKLKQPNNINNLYKTDYKFSKCFIFKSYAYFFSVSFPAIVKLNLINYELQYIDDWVKRFCNKEIKREQVYFRNAYKKEGRVYLPSCCNNQVVEFELEQERFYYHEVGKRSESFSDIVFSKDKIYISKLDGGEMLILDKGNWDEIGRIYTGTTMPVSISMQEYNDKIFYFPVNLSEIVIVEDGNKIRKCDLKMNIKGNKVFKIIYDMPDCYFITEKEFDLIKFSVESEKIVKKKLLIDNDTIKDKLQKYLLSYIILGENFLSIKSWVSLIKNNKINKNKSTNVSMGNKIWNCVKEG